VQGERKVNVKRRSDHVLDYRHDFFLFFVFFFFFSSTLKPGGDTRGIKHLVDSGFSILAEQRHGSLSRKELTSKFASRPNPSSLEQIL
jgi:hypothetical protein